MLGNIVGLLVALLIFGPPLWRLFNKARGAVGLGPATDLTSLLNRGTPARGILLSVGTKRSCQGNASQGYYEVRTVRIDIEVPGKSPYEVDCTLMVPANLRRLVLPGATIELRVDPLLRTSAAVFGPGVGMSAAGFQ